MPKRIDSISRQPKAAAAPEPEKTETVPPAVEPAAEAPKTETPAPEVEAPKTEEPATPAEAPAETPAEAEVPGEPKEEIPDASEVAEGAETAPAGKDSFENLFPEPSVIMSGPPGWVWWLLLIIGAAGLGFLAFDITRGKIDTWLSVSPTASPVVEESATPTASASASPTTVATVTPTPTASPSGIVKSSVTLRVLNGTTVTGAANSTKTTLEKAGFTVRTIGNAKNQNYTATMVYYQSGRQVEAQAVADSLAPTKVTLEESTLASPDMVLVVVGTNK
jgi:hypothetical protein